MFGTPVKARQHRCAYTVQSKTFGQLRSAAHRLVLKLDPDSARRHKEEAKKDEAKKDDGKKE